MPEVEGREKGTEKKNLKNNDWQFFSELMWDTKP